MKSTKKMLKTSKKMSRSDCSPGPVYWKMMKHTHMGSHQLLGVSYFLKYNMDGVGPDVVRFLPVLSVLVVANSDASGGQAGDHTAGRGRG